MPGILPMKVIKMGAGAHLRIAQACDRCRSKKIRCDGVRPCCSQCSAVGFECKTSDKLSRRAFPRGYTESLEERVRSLETEVRELKELLDEKDEKIDMLARIRPQRPSPTSQTRSLSPKQTSPAAAIESSPSNNEESTDDDDVIFTVQQAPLLTEDGQPESYFVGTSSSISFFESFKHQTQEKGIPTADFNAATLLKTAAKPIAKNCTTALSSLQPPSRLASDQFVNIFFQELAPLFPILHRPAFLALYDQYLNGPESVTDQKSLAQLYLVFGLAALSQGSINEAELSSIETQWQTALHQIQTEQCLSTLQCLLLAQLFCMQKGDCVQLLAYKALAVSLACRLGLPQSQKRFALGTLTCETRKKVFWTLYTIDSFSAVQLGLPRQIKDEEVSCEFPVDTDDEYITDQGFLPVLPGESTRISSALALFRAARILSKVLTAAYPALPSYELSSRQIASLAQQLDDWQASLAPHLKLPFVQDKPSAGTVSSRSPLLSLTYHYIRSLIHRPVVCASSSSSESSSSMLAMTDSCKHIVQIVNLLTERGLSFAFCLNKGELLVLSGLGLLMQGLDLEDGSKVLKDNHKTIALVINQLDRKMSRESVEFRRVASSFLPILSPSTQPTSLSNSRRASEDSMPAAQNFTIPAAMKQQYRTMTSNPSVSSLRQQEQGQRRMSHIGIPMHDLSARTQSLQLNRLDALRQSHSEPSGSPQDARITISTPINAAASTPGNAEAQMSHPDLRAHLTLDYLSFSSGLSTPGLDTQQDVHGQKQTDWERMLATIDNGSTNIFDNIYGGAPVEITNGAEIPVKSQHRHDSGQSTDTASAWDPKIWAINDAEMNQAQSDFSLSTESGSRPGSMAVGSMDGSSGMDEADFYQGIVLPELTHSDDGIWDSIDQSYTIV